MWIYVCGQLVRVYDMVGFIRWSNTSTATYSVEYLVSTFHHLQKSGHIVYYTQKHKKVCCLGLVYFYPKRHMHKVLKQVKPVFLASSILTERRRKEKKNYK